MSILGLFCHVDDSCRQFAPDVNGTDCGIRAVEWVQLSGYESST